MYRFKPSTKIRVIVFHLCFCCLLPCPWRQMTESGARFGCHCGGGHCCCVQAATLSNIPPVQDGPSRELRGPTATVPRLKSPHAVHSPPKKNMNEGVQAWVRGGWPGWQWPKEEPQWGCMSPYYSRVPGSPGSGHAATAGLLQGTVPSASLFSPRLKGSLGLPRSWPSSSKEVPMGEELCMVFE